jgi:phosphoglycolate phosphatase-like HAD superfamily hydrolase
MTPGLLVLDFDGVVCDGIDEMGESGRRTIAALTGRDVPQSSRAAHQRRFAALRPAIESGWEMVALCGILAESDESGDGALVDGKRWAAARDAYLKSRGLAPATVAATFDEVRARWMDADPQGWLTRHRFYPGIAAWLTRLASEGAPTYILSTKSKRFLDALLSWQKVPLPSERVIGRAEPKREKWDVIRTLATAHEVPLAHVWFVEDRLATLLDLREHAPDVAAGRLFLADWGYIFRDRDPAAARAAGIPVLALERATGPFSGWVS